MGQLILGKQLAICLIHSQLSGHPFSYLFPVPGEHYRLSNAQCMELADGFGSIGFDLVFQHHRSQILPVYCHQHSGFLRKLFRQRNPMLLQQFQVAAKNLFPGGQGYFYSSSRMFLHLLCRKNGAFISSSHRLCHRVVGTGFRCCSIRQQSVFFHSRLRQ